MAETADAPVKSRAGKTIVGGIAISFIVGFGLGAFSWKSVNAPLSEHEAGIEQVEAPPVDQSHLTTEEIHEVRIGKLTVALADDDGAKVSHMLITPIVIIGAPEGTSVPIPGIANIPEATVEMRDVFMEFLSQLALREVTGSAGMSMIRAELLRRARDLYPDAGVSRVLLQDYLIQ